MTITSSVKDFGKAVTVAGIGLGVIGCSPSQQITPTNRGTVIGGALGVLGGVALAQNSGSSLVNAAAIPAAAILGGAIGGTFDAQCEADPSGYVSEGSGRPATWERNTDIDCKPVGGTLADFNMDPRVPPDTGRREVPVYQQQPVYQPQPVTQTSIGYGQKANGAFWSDGECKMTVFDGRVITVAPEAC